MRTGRRPGRLLGQRRLADGAVGRQPARCSSAATPTSPTICRQGFRRAQGRRQAAHRVDAPPERHPRIGMNVKKSAIRQSQGPPVRSPARSPTRRSWTRLCSVSASRCSARPPTPKTEVGGRSRNKYTTDIAKAKLLMAEAGYPNGFETTILPFDLGFAGVKRGRSACLLTQEMIAADRQQGPRSTRCRVPTGAPSSTR